MINGILAVWKPKGMTSHDVVFKLRKMLRMKKIGHTGTLDPEVDGVLVVCLGKGTRLVELLMDSPKVYFGEITLGTSTETEDAHGEVVDQKAVLQPVSNEKIDKAMSTFEGVIEQIPPMYSAVKVNGRRLYEYAREGLEVERPIRNTVIHSFERDGEPVYNQESGTQSWKFKVDCGKGTYVRTLTVDLGKKLGYPAHMSKLTRLQTSGFSDSESYTLEEIQTLIDNEEINDKVATIETALKHIPKIELDDELYDRVKNGQVLLKADFEQDFQEPMAFYYKDKIIALYRQHPEKELYIKPYKMFV
ncbi:tRNA pseudouridine(55) synthase TruB [Ruoffia tabacinasalis]|uniref:tRNA pseudouridine synthase B n=1 Tax=Ruoffia tabacinasalis TaxID=87458 RepID=A0A5R9EPL7_9LACT|nr:tRNA pseudouridine(55) synthase TruB [Ruoffia tabacinasalis]